jgi:large subunit ribosomal protein L18Ae
MSLPFVCVKLFQWWVYIALEKAYETLVLLITIENAFMLAPMNWCAQIFEKKPTATKNYGIWLRYQSRTGYHNMYKEYRDLTLNGAVEQMYTEMASRHRVRCHQLHIIKTTVVKAADCQRVNITQFHDSQIKFPVLRKYASFSNLICFITRL